MITVSTTERIGRIENYLKGKKKKTLISVKSEAQS